MVMSRFSLCGLLLVAVGANAAVTASIDRADIDLNESFTLEITTDSSIEVQPDVEVLEEDFVVGNGSRLSNTTIFNGQIKRSNTWSYVLMPKRAGQIVIPAITVGNESTNPLVVDISEPGYAPPGEAEVFVTTEVDATQSYVQAQVLLTEKIYRSVAVRQPSLHDPVVSGAEVLQELAGDDRSYEAVINGTAYVVNERVIAIYPQESGEIELSPARFEARVLRDGRITGRKIFESEPLKVTVLPTPAPPADYPNATWLPAHDLQLSEEWSQNEPSIEAGEPLTRHVVVSALGQLETQIPALQPPSVDGVNIYPDKPELGRSIEAGGIRGTRKDQYALIGVRAGTVVLPEVKIPWWNVGEGAWEVASLPARSIIIKGTEEPLPVTPPAEPGATAEVPMVAVASAAAMESDFWRRTSEVLALLLLLTICAWWWSARVPRSAGSVRESEPPPIHRQQATLLKTARKGALANDAAAVRTALLAWSRLQWPQDAPRSIGAIAERVSSPLAEELRALSRLSYGPESVTWDGAAVASALRSFAVMDEDVGRSEELLPPLLPTTSARS